MEMAKSKIIALCIVALSCCSLSNAQELNWTKAKMDGSRTGVVAPNADNVPEAIGVIKGNKYYAPSGRVFKKGSSTYEAAKLVLEAQPAMASVKEVVGYSPKEMVAHRPESELSNLIVDCLIAKTEEVTGKHVDVGFTNFGGIRISMPEGDVLLDDIMSMLPFNNFLCYMEVKGSDLRYLFERFASNRVEAFGGAEMVMGNYKLQSLKVGGKPVDDNKYYGVATIDFLLDGGDGVAIARNARNLVITDVLIRDSLMDYVRKMKAEGKPIEYKTDNRVVITTKKK